MVLDVCDFACLMATGLFASKIYLMVNYNKNHLLQKFDKLLDNEQRERYKKIMKERLRLYLQGMILGLILGFIYLTMTNNKDAGRACLFTVIVLGVNYLYYMLAKKSDYMVPHLTTKEQRNAWLDIYKEMQYRCRMGFVLGIVSFLLFGFFLKV